MKDKKISQIILGIFFLSGISGLIYEVIWVRMLGFVFGTTVYAVSTVLTAFMAGLALGSFWFGRFIDKRKDPLAMYGRLEIGIGFYCMFMPILFKLLTKLYIAVYQWPSPSNYLFGLVRFILSFAVLVIPTILMGATFPVITKFFVRQKEKLGWDVGRLYSVNTFGAVLGCFGAGFLLIPSIGVKATFFTAAIINIGVGITALMLNKSIAPPDQLPATEGSPAKSRAERGERSRGMTSDQKKKRDSELRTPNSELSSGVLTVVLIAFALSGFAALSFEILWTRALVMVLGTSVYAFSTMLTTFLFGIAFGSYLFARVIDRKRDLLALFAAVEIGIGISVILLTPLLGKLPFVFLRMFRTIGGAWEGIVFMEFFISALVMVVPTILFGGTFPIVNKIYAWHMEKLGRSIGNVYAVNTLGAIGGSFVAGFILIPWLGMQRSIVTTCFIPVIVGLVLLGINRNIKLNIRWATISGTALVIVLVSLFMPSWDRGVMDSGVYVYAQNLLRDPHSRSPKELMHMHDKQILYYKEGVYATVSVLKGKYLFLRISGKTDAGTSPDMMTQHLVAHLPLLFHGDPKTALVIGLASGTSLGSALRHPLKEVDCAEISPEVVEASGFFREANHNALSDPRIKLHIVDGRNFVMATDKKYDVIISEPSNPWISGVSNLFTQDFYKLCAEKLNDDGLMCQWFQFYRMSPENLNIAMNTFLSVFPSVTIWSPTIGETPMGDILMVGSKKENFKIDLALLNEKFKDKKIKEDLELININEPFDVLSCFLIGQENAYRAAYKSPLNTDDHPIIEFQAPKTLYQEMGMTILDYIREHAGCGFPPLSNYGKGANGLLELHYKLGFAYSFRGKHLMAAEEFNDCLEINPDFTTAKYLLAMSYHHLGRQEEATRYWKEIIKEDPDSKEAKLSQEQLESTDLNKTGGGR